MFDKQYLSGTATFQPGCSAQGYQPMMATTQVAYAQSTPGQMIPTPYNQNLPKADAPNPAQSTATSSGLQGNTKANAAKASEVLAS